MQSVTVDKAKGQKDCMKNIGWYRLVTIPWATTNLSPPLTLQNNCNSIANILVIITTGSLGHVARIITIIGYKRKKCWNQDTISDLMRAKLRAASSLLGSNLSGDRIEITLALRCYSAPFARWVLLDDLERLELNENMPSNGARAGVEFLMDSPAMHAASKDLFEGAHPKALPQVHSTSDRSCTDVVPVRIIRSQLLE